MNPRAVAQIIDTKIPMILDLLAGGEPETRNFSFSLDGSLGHDCVP